jgi:mono/diheme cytochrome c family protein
MSSFPPSVISGQQPQALSLLSNSFAGRGSFVADTRAQESSTLRDDPGARLFRTHCATCHGATGRGNGPLAEHLRRMPPDLTKLSAGNGGVFPSERVARIIDGRDVPSHGDREMPVWGDAFSRSREGGTAEAAKARIDAIVRYLQGIQERAAE